jgi:hypothetical protein
VALGAVFVKDEVTSEVAGDLGEVAFEVAEEVRYQVGEGATEVVVKVTP